MATFLVVILEGVSGHWDVALQPTMLREAPHATAPNVNHAKAEKP